MHCSDLKSWPIFSLLGPEFVSGIHMVMVYGNFAPFFFHSQIDDVCVTHKFFFTTGNLGNEALIVTKNKKVYALGNNIAGCLGTGCAHSTLYPREVEALCDKDVKMFACGSGPHVLALTENGEVKLHVTLTKRLTDIL